MTDNTRPYIGDDIVPIERFLARMSEIDGKRDEAIERLNKLISNPPPFATVCCQLELRLELARLLMRKNPRQAVALVEETKKKAETYAATAIADASEDFLMRYAH